MAARGAGNGAATRNQPASSESAVAGRFGPAERVRRPAPRFRVDADRRGLTHRPSHNSADLPLRVLLPPARPKAQNHHPNGDAQDHVGWRSQLCLQRRRRRRHARRRGIHADLNTNNRV